MKFLHIIGTVVAFHAALFLLAFVMPGCRSTTRSSPSPADTAVAEPAPQITYPGADSSPLVSASSPLVSSSLDSAPTVSFALPESSGRHNPTRPGNPAAAALTKPATSEVQPVTTYTVVLKDNLWLIAKKFKISSADLAAANNLSLTTPVRVGQKLIIPTKAKSEAIAESAPRTIEGDTLTYKVQSGDNLGLIAKRSGTTVAAIKTLNRLTSDQVYLGQQLILPAGLDTASKLAETPQAPAKPVADTKNKVTHTVRSGETLDQIARKYGVPMKEIAAYNRISDPRKLGAGKVITIPGAGASAAPSQPVEAETTPIYRPAVTPAIPVEQPLITPAQDSGLVTPASDFTPPVIQVDETAPLVTPSK